jgi:transposase
MSVEGGTDGDVFRTSVEQVLVPRLRPGQVVLLDNLKAHKVAGIREALEAARVRLVYLPPYSPDLSPLELCWSKLKTFLRARAARTREALERAWTKALGTITAQDAHHWFAHCGYRTARK